MLKKLWDLVCFGNLRVVLLSFVFGLLVGCVLFVCFFVVISPPIPISVLAKCHNMLEEMQTLDSGEVPFSLPIPGGAKQMKFKLVQNF